MALPKKTPSATGKIFPMRKLHSSRGNQRTAEVVPIPEALLSERVGEAADNKAVDEGIAYYLECLAKNADPMYVPVNVYLGTDSLVIFQDIKAKLRCLLGCVADGGCTEKTPVKGSWFQELVVRFRKIRDSEATRARIEKLEHLLEVETLGKAQASIDKAEAEAASALIASLNSTDEAIIQIGSIVLVKTKNTNGSSVGVITLTPKQLIHLRDNPRLLRNPTAFLDRFSLADESADQWPTLKKG